MRRFCLLLLVGLFVWVESGVAQEASVSGYVTDASSGETLLLANVVIAGTTTGATTNTSGYYTLTGLAPGRYTLACSYLGYLPFSQEVILAAGEALRLDIELRPDELLLDEVVIEAEAESEDEQKAVGAVRLRTQLVKQLPSVLQADVFRSLQLLPGVKAASDFSSGLYIRGGGPDQTLIMLDRTTVYNPTHFFGFFSTFNPDAIKDVRLYKGGYPAEYGGRLGAVVDIYNKDGNRKNIAGGLSLGLLSSRFSVEGPYQKGSWMFALRRSTLEPVLAALRNSIDGIPNGFYFVDVNAKANLDLSAANKFSASFYMGQDKVDFPVEDDFQINLTYGNRTGSLNWTHIFSEQLFSNFTFTGSRYFNEPELALRGTSFQRVNEVFDFSAKGDFEYIPNERHAFKGGFWSGLLTLKINDQFDGQDTFQSRIQTSYVSGYAQYTWKPTYQWQIKSGVRSNYFSKGDYFRLEPRLSVEYRPAETLRFQAAYGRYYQFLTLVTNEAFSGFDTWLTTDTGVPPAWGDQFVLGAKTQPWLGYNFDVEVYYRTMEDLFEIDPFLPDPAGLDYADLFRFGSGYSYGAEFFLEKTEGRFNGFIGYTWSRTRRTFPRSNAGRAFPPKYDRVHDLNIVANYDLSQKWRATAVFSYATGQAYTQPLGQTRIDNPFGNTNFNSNGNGVFTVGRVNASRLPAYHRLDVGFTRRGRFFNRADAELQIQVINVYSRRNVWFFQYDFEENPVEVTAVRMLPILPNISYTITF